MQRPLPVLSPVEEGAAPPAARSLRRTGPPNGRWAQPLRVPGWEGIPHLVHGFFGRRGGVSRGTFAALNLSSRVGDDPGAVENNWRRVVRATGGALRFVTMRQVHGNDVGVVEHAAAQPAEVDALVSQAAGVALSVLTADCVPLLFVAPAAHVVAAVHAGWRGTLAGIAERTLQCLDQAFAAAPADICVALGPAIGGCCYEVDAEIVTRLEESWGPMPEAVHRIGDGKPRLDLRQANVVILTALGIQRQRIAIVGPCSRCAAADYFSYRGANGSTGRQLSFIGWADEKSSDQ